MMQNVSLRKMDAGSILELLTEYQTLLRSSIDCQVVPNTGKCFDPADRTQLAADRYNLYRAKGLAGVLAKSIQEAR